MWVYANVFDMMWNVDSKIKSPWGLLWSETSPGHRPWNWGVGQVEPDL